MQLIYYANYFSLDGLTPNCIVLVAMKGGRNFPICRTHANFEFFYFLNLEYAISQYGRQGALFKYKITFYNKVAISKI